MNVRLISTPAENIRAEQAGDWWTYGNNNTILVHVIDGLPPESQLAIAIHEVIEAWLCRFHGISDEDVVTFDNHYEAERENGDHGPEDEPGDDPCAPYRAEHMAATHVERAVCAALGITWKLHELSVQQLAEVPRKTESPELSHPELPLGLPQHVLD